MAGTVEPSTVIEEVLRSSVLPGLGVRIRAMSDDELALNIIEALDVAGFEIIPKERANT